jgi:hypothetical protein
MKVEFSRQILEKRSNVIFHENPSSGSRVVPCGQTDRHDQVNRVFHNFQKTPKSVEKVKFVVQRTTAKREPNFHVSGN